MILTTNMAAYATLVLPKIFSNNMVLQQGVPVAVWGTSRPGAKVTVTFKHEVKAVVADDKGQWKLFLKPLKASGKPAVLNVATTTDTLQLNNVLVGEVWLCSGQSNMEFAMRKLAKLQPPAGEHWPVNEVATANNNLIRTFLVERKKMEPGEQHDGWINIDNPAFRNFSAVAYFFAKELQQRLHVPVGVISAAIPGSAIEPWMPAEAMFQEPFFRHAGGDPARKISGDAGKFYYTMIEPLIPFAIKGFLWCQGESNCFLNERIEYSYKMKALINYWREKWNNSQLPFYYVQIAPYFYSKATDRPYTVFSEPAFWEAQAAVLKMPHTLMIATTDLNTDLADLHPVNKWDVGQRLAHAALSKTYKADNRPPMGPVFKSALKQGNTFILDFDYKGKGLKSKDGQPLNFFEVADVNGDYHEAEARIKDNKIYVYAKDVTHPYDVRFGWREDADPNLVNSAGLPALPFRTNNPIIDNFN
ncbi:sialate O-acetylesterase [Niabella insulamsoli]|uniref:sialate O-acetylesterase n=1 Tax=Niabella insulamsoli TaxID=3144874 RepID=UPI0031FE0063